MSDPTDGVELTPEEFTIHASEKVSTGDYENGTYSLSLTGSVEGVEDLTDAEHEALYAMLLREQKNIQRQVEQAAKNRTKIKDHENWEVDADV